MEVKQIYDLINGISGELIGKTDLIHENLDNIVDFGAEIENLNQTDNYVKTLINRIGKTIFSNRLYTSQFPTIYKDAWEFGSVLQKLSMETPQATENETWELENEREYKQDIFYKPSITAKYYNSKVTFEIPISITDRQVKESFINATQLNAFLTLIDSTIRKSMTSKLDALAQRCINAMITNTLQSSNNVIKVDLLGEFNLLNNAELDAETALTSSEFLKFANYKIATVSDRLTKLSTLFNIGATEKFTPKDYQNLILLSDFAKSTDFYLKSDTYHDNFLNVKNFTTVPYWQGSGKNYEFAAITTIKFKDTEKEKTTPPVIGVLFDRDCCGVTNLNERVTTHYNAKAEFYNNYYKVDGGYFADTNENFVVFTLGSGIVEEPAE